MGVIWGESVFFCLFGLLQVYKNMLQIFVLSVSYHPFNVVEISLCGSDLFSVDVVNRQ